MKTDVERRLMSDQRRFRTNRDEFKKRFDDAERHDEDDDLDPAYKILRRKHREFEQLHAPRKPKREGDDAKKGGFKKGGFKKDGFKKGDFKKGDSTSVFTLPPSARKSLSLPLNSWYLRKSQSSLPLNICVLRLGRRPRFSNSSAFDEMIHASPP